MALSRSRSRRESPQGEEEDCTPTTYKKRLKEEKGTVPLRRSLRLISNDGKFKDEPMCKNRTSMKRWKLPNKELGRKRKEGNVPFLRSRQLKSGRKVSSLEEFFRTREEEENRAELIEPRETTYLKPEQLAKFALADYNTKYGTDLEYVRLLHGTVKSSYSLGLCIDFVEKRYMWTHFNFEARRHNADTRDEPLLLFAEVYRSEEKYHLTTLSLVKDSDDASGCQSCFSNIRHPPHGFRAGFDSSGAARNPPELLSEEVAVKLTNFALQDYNEKNGTDLKFTSALQGYRFTCSGLLMDFTEKNTSWVHMNFVARVGGLKEEVLRLFGELYLVDDDKYVLATLSATDPAKVSARVKEKIVIGCCCCPADSIYHPWRGFRYCFNYPPCRNIPPPNR